MQDAPRLIDRQETDLLASRVRTGLIVWIGAATLFAVSDLWLGPPRTLAMYLVRAANLGALGGYFYLHGGRTREQIERVALVMMALAITILAVSGAITTEPTAALILTSVLILGAATVLPWSYRCQVIAVVICAPAVSLSVAVSSGSLASVGYEPMLGVYASLGASLYIARVLEKHRKSMNQATAALQQEAELSARLARVGRELIASLDEPAMLKRLCQLTADVLDCDVSYTLLTDGQRVRIAEGFGYTDDEWESLKNLDLRLERTDAFLLRLDREGVLYIDLAGSENPLPKRFTPRHPVSSAIYYALRKGGEIVGFQAAGYRQRRNEPTAHEVRLARGVSHLASLALESARLVEALERANRFKSDFLATMSHELRTPLNIIIGYNEMLADHAFGPLNGEQLATVTRVRETAEDQLALINVSLELSRFEAKDLPLELEEVDLNLLLESLRQETKVVVGKHLRFEWQSAPDLPEVRTDPVKLRMILKNLIDNAAKYTDHGTVRIASTRTRDTLRFEVSDTGPGIPADGLETIFDAFQQLDARAAGKRDGVGLGLHIVSRLVTALGGSIDVQSEVGSGTTFAVELPFDQARPAPLQQASA